MAKIVSVHAFRQGSGKENLVASVADLLAAQGARVGIIDTDLRAPSTHIRFNVDEMKPQKTWNDYLWREASIQDIAFPVTLVDEKPASGKIYLISTSDKVPSVLRILREGISSEQMKLGFLDFIQTFNLDVLLLNTGISMSQETMLSLAVSNTFLVIVGLENQEYEDLGIALDIAQKLGVTETLCLINNAPVAYSVDEIHRQMKENYTCQIMGVIPHDAQLLALASRGVFSERYPEAELTKTYKKIAKSLLA